MLAVFFAFRFCNLDRRRGRADQDLDDCRNSLQSGRTFGSRLMTEITSPREKTFEMVGKLSR